MPEPWPPDLLDKAHILLKRGYRYRPGPPEALFDTFRDDVVTRAELGAATPDAIAARVPPLRPALAIGFRGGSPIRR